MFSFFQQVQIVVDSKNLILYAIHKSIELIKAEIIRLLKSLKIKYFVMNNTNNEDVFYTALASDTAAIEAKAA